MKNLLTLAVVCLFSVTAYSQTNITGVEVSKHIGDSVTICEVMTGGRFLEKSSLTLLNFGGAYPNQAFTAVIRGKLRDQFKAAPETDLKGKKVCITGKLETYNGKPQIIITDPNQLVVIMEN